MSVRSLRRLGHALGIEGDDLRARRLQRRHDVERGRVAHVVGVGLEGEAQHADRQARDRAAAEVDDLAAPSASCALLFTSMTCSTMVCGALASRAV